MKRRSASPHEICFLCDFLSLGLNTALNADEARKLQKEVLFLIRLLCICCGIEAFWYAEAASCFGAARKIY